MINIFNWLSRVTAFRMIRFGLTGLSGMVLDFAITWFLKEKLGWNRYLANTMGFCAAVCSNYLINRNWTFNNVSTAVLPQLGLFVGISAAGLLLNTAIIFLLHQRGNMNFYLSKCAAIAVVFTWNYWANSHFTFTLYQ